MIHEVLESVLLFNFTIHFDLVLLGIFFVYTFLFQHRIV